MAATTHLSTSEADITRRASVRWQAFLQAELEELPEWHPQSHEYSIQLASLERRRQLLRPLEAY